MQFLLATGGSTMGPLSEHNTYSSRLIHIKVELVEPKVKPVDEGKT
jgi:hypothetical protein